MKNSIKSANKSAKTLLATALCSSFLYGCATVSDPNPQDPYESFNRGTFEFNRVVDGVILRPIAVGYSEAMPDKGKEMVSNFVSNIKEPVTFANSILQADPHNSFASLWRFLLNSTVGVGGLFDAATEIGLKDRETGFADTMAVYGAEAGPYFIIPIIGPSSTRDSFGRLVDLFTDPTTYADPAITYSVVGIKTVDTRYHKIKLLDDVYSTSLDPYSSLRSMYLQYREADVAKVKKSVKKSQDAAFSEKTK